MQRLSNINIDVIQQAMARMEEPVEQRFPKVIEWIEGRSSPTARQLARFAKMVHIPFGFFFLEKMPPMDTGVPLFRTHAQRPTTTYSDELRDTVRLIQERQEWLREYLQSEGKEPLPFVGKYDAAAAPHDVAKDIRNALKLDEKWAAEQQNWTTALKYLIKKTEAAGIFVAVNGVVGNNTRRTLNPKEFRGFVLTDRFAPYVFINGADFTAAKLFTLAHELAHIWLGASAAFDLRELQSADNPIERKCDQIAAEFLVPEHLIVDAWEELGNQTNKIELLARDYKVSQLVVARRLLDTGRLSKQQFFNFYNTFIEEVRRRQEEKKSPGGDFYNNQNYRVGSSFFSQVIQATKEGKLLYTDAYKLTGLYGITFSKYQERFNS